VFAKEAMPLRTTIGVRVFAPTRRELEAIARQRKVTLGEVVRLALLEWLHAQRTGKGRP
jgi:hypothetical protein